MNDDNDKRYRGNAWQAWPTLSPKSRHTVFVCLILIFVALLISTIFIIVHTTYIAQKKILLAEHWLRSITAENKHLRSLIEIRLRESLLYADVIKNHSLTDQIPHSRIQYDTRKSFAIVMPYAARQIGSILSNMNRWIQDKYQPLDDGLLTSRRAPVDLVFYYNRDRVEDFERQINAHISSLGIQKYFRRIYFRYANLKDDEDPYPIGVTHQYYKLFDDHRFRTDYDYFFYMEPDCLPIRNGWLDMLREITFNTFAPFWVQGSIYRGVKPVEQMHRMHINSNAIYSTTHSYFAFLQEVKRFTFSSFDVDQYEYLVADFGRQKNIWHKFVYSDYIMNMWTSQYSENQIKDEFRNTYFVHGGMNTDVNTTNKLW